jgi:hypothetical protein
MKKMTVAERKLRREELHLEWVARNIPGSRQHAEAVVRYVDLKLRYSLFISR